jgi:hypothetical protein
LTVLSVDTTAATGIVSNPSFETGTTGWVAAGTGASIAQTTAQAYFGADSLAFTTGTAIGNSARLTVGTVLAINTTYTFSFYAKAATAFSTLSASYSPDGTAANETDCAVFSPSRSVVTTGWTRYVCTIDTPALAPSASGYVAIKQSDATSRVVYIDGVQIGVGSAITQAQVANTGFEAGTTGWAYLGTPGSIAQSAVDKYNGAQSLLISTTTNANNGAKYTTGNTNPTQLAASTSYIFSFWAKASGANVTTLAAAYARDGATENNCGLSSTTASTTSWTYFSCSIVTDSTAPTASAYISIKQTDAATHTWYIDDVQLTKQTFISPGDVFKQSGIALNGVISSPVVIKPQTDTTAAFQIQNADGNTALSVDTINNRVTLGTRNSLGNSGAAVIAIDNNAGYLQLQGSSSSNGTGGGAIFLIGDGSTIAQSGRSVAGDVQMSLGSSTADYIFNNSGSSNRLFIMTNTGQATFQNSVNSTTAFQVLNTAGTQVLGVDTSNLQVNTGNLNSTGTITLQNGQGASIQLRTVSSSSTGLTLSGN